MAKIKKHHKIENIKFEDGNLLITILLGSSSLDLLDQSAESLTGRNWKIVLPPLTFSEALSSQDWTGNEVSIHELATQLSMARPTVERYLALLEQTFVIFRVPAFSTNPRKEISKSQKVYFWDTGIRNALLNAFAPDELRPDIGSLWENWVIAEMAKTNLLVGSPCELFFWRSRSQAEVDLVVKSEHGLKAFEIKWASRRIKSSAFNSVYGVEVSLISPANPFFAEFLGKT